MASEHFGACTLEVCGGCQGLWFDRGELARLDHGSKGFGTALERALRAQRRGPRPREVFVCPPCGTAMQNHRNAFLGVALDRCPACGGVFLRAGVLAALRARPASAEERAERERHARWREAWAGRQEREESLWEWWDLLELVDLLALLF